MTPRLVVLGATVAAFALAGCVTKREPAAPVGSHVPMPEPEKKQVQEEKSDPVADDSVENAALPFHGVRASDSEELSNEELLDELARADAVCVGEDHDGVHDHWAELRILAGLLDRAAMSGREVGLGLEMLPRGTERAIEAFKAGSSDEKQFLTDSHWDRNWGWDYAYYRPILELARQHGIAIVPLNARRELTRAVAHGGLGSLAPELEKQLPELDLDDHEHRAWFEKQMREHPSPHFHMDTFYAAQVVWDETMADSAARWLHGRLPSRQLVVLAGAGHCRTRAVPRRIERRSGAKVVNVRPVVVSDDDKPAAALDGYAYGFVMTAQ